MASRSTWVEIEAAAAAAADACTWIRCQSSSNRLQWSLLGIHSPSPERPESVQARNSVALPRFSLSHALRMTPKNATSRLRHSSSTHKTSDRSAALNSAIHGNNENINLVGWHLDRWPRVDCELSGFDILHFGHASSHLQTPHPGTVTMSLTVRHLNADSTFLLTFLPAKTRVNSTEPIPGAFSILLDPWLSGAAAFIHPDFSIVQHTVPACINSLADIPEPDLVVISCAKPDHCHEDTLRQLPSHGTKTRILASATTAKTIRSWNHFDPEKVQIFEKYDPQHPKRETIQRFHIPPISAFGSPGEVTVAYIPGKFDVAKLHAAIGVTYRPPTGLPTYFDQVPRPLSPPESPNSSASGWSTSYSSPGDRTMSVIFSPHGLPWSQIQPYASSHLVAESALPLTALLHPFDRVQNPWWLGGNVSAGLPGGLEIARNLLARYWISAHDEEKDVGGITALPLRTEKFFRWQIERLIEHEMGRMGTEVVEIDVGHALVMGAL